MSSLGRRKFLKKMPLLAGVPIIAWFPILFSVENARGTPKPTKDTKKTVSPAKPPTKKPPTKKP
jgi:hypothetical protein